ncbi:MAG: winged helix-turn-helix domain-containing protein [Candidatus Acidiferrum sp.]
MTDLGKPRLRFGPCEVDLSTRELWKSGVRVKLGGQPFEILTALLERPGQLVNREELRKRVWSEDTFVDFSHGLNAAVNKLREALCDSADEPRYIETLPRRGYRFIAPIEEVSSAPPIAGPPQPAVLPQSVVSASEPVWKGSLSDEEWESTVPVKRHTLVQLSVLVAATFVLALGITAIWKQWSTSPSPDEAALARGEAEHHQKQLAEQSRPRAPRDPYPESPQRGRNAVAEPTVSRQGPAPSNPPASGPEPSSLDDSPLMALARSGRRVELSQVGSASDGPAIFRLDLMHINDANPLTRIVAGREAIGGPQPSPDGSKLVFMAGRTDAMDIWVCNSDGASPRKLTNTGRAGTPRWSPDGRWIVFDSDGRYGRSGIYVVSVDGGQVRPVVEDHSNNSVPSWSRDGKYIYFSSNRGWGWENDQVWKVPAEGGQPLQITRQGGFSAYESKDGQRLYYAKSRYQNPEIWQVPVNGGTESRVSLLHPTTWASWALTNKGILLLSEYSGQSSELQYFDFATRSIHSMATLQKASFWLASSAKGSLIWYSELTDSEANKVFKAGLD